ncbi:cyclic di-GMP phosphodiesterase [Enterobacteriaceae bacterium H20N1]|uniref:cyclic-guanylate-specific phosphodiesterase n=1 Tax=Dryocola boscaweniae TaxID=2925397 RepID=A0A9X3AQA3_9ENTR|nr:cyclic di-GMP phosphodiesterase [Dryocola boscaweniae]MCT4702470.1 cyclic di-GMP phosphodiesterase [Dryocola boscaweniae]MCT4719638.1 cyclic di-GMP phosphodiesterase [Dryocola boscaweniae]
MSPDKIFARYFSTPKQMAYFSVVVGLVSALLFGGLTSLMLHNKREAGYDVLTKDIRHYLDTFFHDLHVTADSIQPLTAADCPLVSPELTSRAAFNVNVRVFVLIRQGVAYCSSATGAMSMPMNDLIPDIDLNKNIDLFIMTGTPMMPGKPTIVAWFKNPATDGRGVFTTLNANLIPYLLFTARQSEVLSMAIVVGDRALTTLSPEVVNVGSLPAHPTRIAALNDYPIKIHLYGTSWPLEDIQLSLLTGLIFGLFSGVICSYFLCVRMRPGKEILIGMKRGQFYVVYQPVVDAQKLEMQGIEALMRWEHPTAGMIPPDAFIAFAEAQQLIVPLTRHLFALVARDAQELQTVLPPGAKLGINLAPSHLHAPTFKDDIIAFAASLPPHHFKIVFEITERDMLKEKEAMSLFSWLHAQGFEIAIDDFGTGHSALIYLERFTLDYLKIDQGFVNTIGMETVTAPVLDAVLTLARRLNMTTVAEGVETREQAKWLIERGVNFLQGYYFSRPLTLTQLLSWSQSQNSHNFLKDVH